MKKSGFTLAEILISLMILGVIAALTIPSLIQNTQKKEEVVKIKKGLSMINQALSMDYSLTGEHLKSGGDLINLAKRRMSVVDIGDGSNMRSFTTQDGLTFMYDSDWEENWDNMYLWIVTKNYDQNKYDNKSAWIWDMYDRSLTANKGNLNGAYPFKCYPLEDRCIPSEGTAAILNASDPTKAE